MPLRQGQAAARNILVRQPFVAPPYLWSNHFDLHIRYVGHNSGEDRASGSRNLKGKRCVGDFPTRPKVTIVASVGRDLENLKAEVALEGGEEFGAL